MTMRPTEHVALVGFPAAGKSSVGLHLARELNVDFTDSDAELVARHGSIPALFARIGEGGFRALEYAVVSELLALPPRVLALGGGAITHAPTRALLAERALRVYLDVPLATLIARLREAPDVRPLLSSMLPSRARVRALLAEREPLYREADMIVRSRRGTPAELAREIAQRLEGHGDVRANGRREVCADGADSMAGRDASA